MRRIFAACVVGALIGGCGDDSSSDTSAVRSGAAPAATTTRTIRGCVPQCLPRNFAEPGPVPAGRYATRYFFAGKMRVDFDRGWAVGEDSTGEFSASPSAHPALRVIFWEDVYPTRHKHGLERVNGVPRTAGGLIDWLRKNPNLSVTRPKPGSIGGLPAKVIEVKVAESADNDDPGCPAKPCANFLGFSQWEETYGIAGRGVTRLYLSDVAYGGRPHLLVAGVEAPAEAQLDAALPAAERLIATTQVPARPA